MKIPLTELQQFFGAYFNQDWTIEYSTADEVIDAFLLDSSRATITIVKKEILELINDYIDEPALQKNLLHKQHCYYYYPSQWASGLSWLNHIIVKFDNYLVKQENPV
ncbi:contact-dependent growth inhibition system immunity protein [Pseudomonas canadensis]|uniref:contact-dependent growth inhibition system immunity protein n=1 Tax=Pseudomonas canadensis TaxID=915099 RepID=UPI000F06E24C|nr:contact-dependent growth inhibition system immunity protein [Pseudomonas canadensis]